jgi:CSLREA domain-containing protein
MRAKATFAVAAVAGLGLALLPAGATAATIVVGVTDDAAPGSFDDTGCTLRDAVQAANINAPFSDCNGNNAGADTIVLGSGKTYKLTQHASDDTNAKGDLDITGQTTIESDGSGLATIDAASNIFPGIPDADRDRAIDVKASAGAVTLKGLRITGGFIVSSAAQDGGGGIRNDAPLTVTGSEIVDNGVVNNGAVASAIVLGGGIFTRGPLGTLKTTGSTIADNLARAAGNLNPEAVGGGIAVYNSSPTLSMTNSTVSGNSVTGSSGVNNGPGVVGGVFAGDNNNHPVANLTNVTITDNHAFNPGGSFTGGVEIAEGTMKGDLVAGNTDPFDTFPDCDDVGPVTSGGGNLIGDTGDISSCNFSGPNDLVGTQAAPITPNLGTLLDNGGPTPTHLPNPGSPAIDRGGTCPTTDQRGLVRVPVAPCDAGAVEVGALPRGPASVKRNGKVKVGKGAHRRLVVQTGIDASCPIGGAACTGTAAINRAAGAKRPPAISRRAKPLGTTTLSIAAGKAQAVKVTLRKKASRALRREGELKVKISVSLTAPGGVPANASRSAKLRPPKRRHHH